MASEKGFGRSPSPPTSPAHTVTVSTSSSSSSSTQELQNRLSQPLTTLLHNPGGSDALSGIAATGLLPLNHRNNPSTKQAYGGGIGGSNHDPNSVYAGGPNVIAKHFSGRTKEFAHVVAKNTGDFMHDHDYDHLKSGNDSREYHGAIPPVRDANFSDQGPVSFTLPMTPRSRAGLSRYLTGSEAHTDAAYEATGRAFQQRFEPMNKGMSSYHFPDITAPTTSSSTSSTSEPRFTALSFGPATPSTSSGSHGAFTGGQERTRTTTTTTLAPIDFSAQPVQARSTTTTSALSLMLRAPNSTSSTSSTNSNSGALQFSREPVPAQTTTPYSALTASLGARPSANTSTTTPPTTSTSSTRSNNTSNNPSNF